MLGTSIYPLVSIFINNKYPTTYQEKMQFSRVSKSQVREDAFLIITTIYKESRLNINISQKVVEML